jgi:hypothetical protein
LPPASKPFIDSLRISKERHEQGMEDAMQLQPSGEVRWTSQGASSSQGRSGRRAGDLEEQRSEETEAPLSVAGADPAAVSAPVSSGAAAAIGAATSEEGPTDSCIKEWFGQLPGVLEISTLRPVANQEEHVATILMKAMKDLKTPKAMLSGLRLNAVFKAPRDRGRRLTNRSLDEILSGAELIGHREAEAFISDDLNAHLQQVYTVCPCAIGSHSRYILSALL